jgi:hypothetical protein
VWLVVATVLLTTSGCGWSPLLKDPAVPVSGPVADAPAHSDASPAGPDGAAPPNRRLEGPLNGRTGAVLTLGSAAAAVDLRLTDLPGLLYRVSTPAGSGLAPRVTGADGAIRLRLTPTGEDGTDRVTILLNRQVRWDLRLTAGAGEQHLDLSRGRVGAVLVGAGTGLVRLRLPRPRGTVPIRLSGAVGSAQLSAPAGVPVAVRLARGATSVHLPWLVRAPAEAGATLRPPGWPLADDRYELDARGDVGRLTLTASAAPS